MRAPYEHRGAIAISANAALVLAATFALFLLPNVAVVTAGVLLLLTLSLMIIFLAIVFDDGIPLRRARILFAGGLVLSCLLLSFAGIYHDQSTLDHQAFSRPLNRLNALYFAIGALDGGDQRSVRSIERGEGRARDTGAH
jgi:hypothetical protein